MNNKEFDISSLKNCIKQLKVCNEDYKTVKDEKMQEYIQDSCIKRYEFTVETAWKLMKRYLKLAYGKEDKELTMNNIFRYMEGYGFVKSWEKWKEYYSKRNDTSHEYNQEKAKEVINYIDDLIKDTEFLYKQFENVLEE